MRAPLQQLQRWSNRSLANTFALRAALIAIASSLMVAVVSLAVIYQFEQVTLTDHLNEKSQRAAERIEAAIGILENSSLDLTTNPIFMTALLDSTGRQTYVVPFLQNYKFPVSAASGLALCDINGELLAATRSPLSACRADSPLFKQVVAGGGTVKELVSLGNGHAIWAVYLGVVFAYTGTVEGVLVAQLDLNDVLRPTTNDLALDRIALARAGSVETFVSEGATRTATTSEARTLLFKGKADAAPFPIEVVADDHLSHFGTKLLLLVVGYTLGSLLLVLVVVYRARQVSQLLIAPLTELTSVAEKVAQSGDLTITMPRSETGEVGQLAKAFEAMVESLRVSEATLEHKVAVRTEELQKSEAAAETANRAKSNFLAAMSHEIRTPMNGILGMAQMLLKSNINEAERQDYARIILNSGQTLLALLNDILDVSKVEAGKLELESAAFEPGQLLHETQALFAETAILKGLAIESAWVGVVGQSGQPAQRYLGDPHRLNQMLSNLVSNAIKFTAKGHIRIEAREVERDGAYATLEFAVTDTGIGIPKEKQALLFKPFSQADNTTTREYGGSGLGLSIVRNLAKLMDGDAGIESETGEGSRFWFRIRVELIATGTDSRDEPRQEKVDGGDTATDSLKSTHTDAVSGHILVVDDNLTNRLVLKAMLNKPGVRCDFVENGQQAVAAITGGMNPDLVLMDCQMPVMDGFEATIQIRRWETEHARPHLTIVALTAGAFEDDRKRCLDVGMDDFLVKPIDIEKLMTTLGRWLVSSTSDMTEVVEMAEIAKVPPATPTPPVAIAQQEDGPPVFDAKTLLAQLGGDRELAKAIIVSAMGDIPRYFDQLDQAIAAGNWKDAERQTHTLKGLTAQIGGMRLTARMKAVDDHLKKGGKTDDATVTDLRREYQTLSATLLEWIG